MVTSKNDSSNANIIEVKLPAESLEVGMHVTRLDRPWTEVPVLMQGLVIETSEDLEVLREHCEYVFIEIAEEFWLEKTGGNTDQITTKIYPGLVENKDIHEELPQAKLTIMATHEHLEDVFNHAASGETFNLEESRLAVKACINSIMNNANALLWLSKIQDQDKYTTEHSMRVGILSIAFGRFLGIEGEDLEILGLCGMLHDVGKARIPDDILNKPARLSRIEYTIMQEHAKHGKELLEAIGDVPEVIRDTAMSHHERIDGKGYPDQLMATYLHRFIRMVSIVDVYDAITSARPYKIGQPAFDALKILFAECDKHFDKDLVEAFIRMVGVYPTGTLVEMTNGEIAIVVASNPNAKLRPKVELVLTASKKKRAPYIIDLSTKPVDRHGNLYAIKEGLTNGTYGVDVKEYIY